MSYQEIKEKLDAKLSRDAVSTRSNGQAHLSYVSTHYVLSRLNETLGQGNWSYEIRNLTNVFSGTVAQRGGDVFSASYIASVVLSGRIGDVEFHFNDVGYGDGTDKVNPGKAHELATKEAVTDAIKRCAKNLGPNLGLALYDKEQNDVEEAPSPDQPEANTKPAQVTKPTATITPNIKPVVGNASLLGDSKPAIGANPKILKSTLKSSVKVLIAQGKMTAEDFTKSYADNKKVDDMSESEVLSTYAKIKTKFTELNLQ